MAQVEPQPQAGAEKSLSLPDMIDTVWGKGDRLTWADTSFTVNLDGLQDDAEMLAAARYALRVWNKVTGFTFTEMSGSAEIVFDNENGGAYASNWYYNDGQGGRFLYHSDINVDRHFQDAWPADRRWGVGDYGAQTFIHEIGHALGLRHPGPYNANGAPITHENDAIYAMDTYQYSVMSYFRQSSFSDASDLFVATPMLVDLAAIETLYGPRAANAGNTIYGTSGIYDFSIDAAFTINDISGFDVIDLGAQVIGVRVDLNQGAFSDVNGFIKNVAVAYGTVIEGAIGGAGHDLLVGNAVGNDLFGGDGDDTLMGGGGDDTLEGGAGRDVLIGGDGLHDVASYEYAGDAVYVDLSGGAFVQFADDDPNWPDAFSGVEDLRGSRFDDELYGDDGANVIDGGAGADFMRGWLGDDRYVVDDVGDIVFEEADEGLDTVYATVSLSTLFDAVEKAVVLGSAGLNVGGNALDNTMTGGAGDDTLSGGVGYDSILGGGGADRLVGDDGNDILLGGAGSDTLEGGDGNDVLEGGLARDVLVGGDGIHDVASYEHAAEAVYVDLGGYYLVYPDDSPDWPDTFSGVEDLRGSRFDDELYGDAGANVIDGGAGADVMVGWLGDDRYRVDDLRDRVYEDSGEGLDRVLTTVSLRRLFDNVEQAVVQGSAGLSIAGNDLDNKMTGGVGADTLSGGDGNDKILGGAGADRLLGDGGTDSLDGEAGDDTLLGGAGADKLLGGDGADELSGEEGNDALDGGADVDILLGGLGNDRLDGGAGADALSGGLGKDQLFGGDGDDRLVGGEDGDVLTGGAGADAFVWTSLAEFRLGVARDRIVDFQQGTDKIDLSAIKTAAADGAYMLLADGTFTGAGGELRLVTIKGAYVVQGDTDGGKAVDLEIAVASLTGPLTLTAADFLL